MSRPLLYGADGHTVLVEEMTEQDRMVGLLVEVFGLLIGYNGTAPKPLTVQQALPIIADCVGVEKLEERFTGLKLEVTKRPAASGQES